MMMTAVPQVSAAKTAIDGAPSLWVLRESAACQNGSATRTNLDGLSIPDDDGANAGLKSPSIGC
jgi:hypothetical protein